MALEKTYIMSTDFGIDIEIPKTYIKINGINGNKNNFTISVILLNKNNNKQIETKYYSFVPSLDGDNFIKQAYLYLKTLPEYADATDC